MAYYIATVKVQDENERGRITNTNEVYCVEAETVTEAEAKVVKEFEGYQLIIDLILLVILEYLETFILDKPYKQI